MQVPREVKDNDVRLLSRYRLTEVILASAQPGREHTGTHKKGRGGGGCVPLSPLQRPRHLPDSDGSSEF